MEWVVRVVRPDGSWAWWRRVVPHCVELDRALRFGSLEDAEREYLWPPSELPVSFRAEVWELGLAERLAVGRRELGWEYEPEAP